MKNAGLDGTAFRRSWLKTYLEWPADCEKMLLLLVSLLKLTASDGLLVATAVVVITSTASRTSAAAIMIFKNLKVGGSFIPT